MTTPAHPSRLPIWALVIPAVLFAAFVVKDLVAPNAPSALGSPSATPSSRGVAVVAPAAPPTAEGPRAASPPTESPQPVPSPSATTQAPLPAAELLPAPTVSLRRYLDQRRVNNDGTSLARKADSPLGGSVRLARQLFGDKAATPDPEREHTPPSSTDGR